MKNLHEYRFINYQNEVIHIEVTSKPEQVEAKLRKQGHTVGGFTLLRTIK